MRRSGVSGCDALGCSVRSLNEENTTTSDLDFLVEFDSISFNAYMDLKVSLEKLFGCPVDLVLSDALKPRLREPILSETIHAGWAT